MLCIFILLSIKVNFSFTLSKQLQTDKAFWHGLQRIIQGRQNSNGKGKTFLYRFAVDSPTQNHYRINHYGTNVRGVCHGDELSYLFKNQYGDVPPQSTIEFKSIERFVSFHLLIFNYCVHNQFFFHKS